MKYLIVFIISTLLTISGFSQSRSYWSAGGEMLFSWASVTDNGVSESSTLRWAPVINLQGRYNADLSDIIGMFTGIFCRNVGYIYDNYQDRNLDGSLGNPHKKKFRSYNIGLPLAIKVGNLDGFHFFGGYEIEVPIRYKEKTFDGDDKTNTTTGWFSDRQEMFQHGFIAGIQFPYDFNVKFKYYLSEFHNQNYTQTDGVKPYSGLESNVMYISLGYNFSFD